MDDATFKAWRSQDDTKVIYKYLKKKRDECMDSWANGNFTTDTCEGTALLNAEAIAIVNVLNDILNLEAEDVS